MADSFRIRAILEAQDKATPALRKVSAETTTLTSRFEKLTGVSVAMFAKFAGGLFAVQKLGQALKQGVTDALAAERAQRSLAVAIERTGGAVDEIVPSLNAQAEALQKTTRFTKDSVTEAQAFLANLGVQGDLLDEAARATVNLSEALGIGLREAARNVGKTVGGFAGELGELIPELKDIDAEALKAGEGILFLDEKFKGAATEGAKTLEGSLQGLRNDLQDLLKVFVQGATDAGDFASAITQLRVAVQEITPVFSRVGEEVSAVVKDVGLLVSVFQALDDRLTALAQPFNDTARFMERLGLTLRRGLLNDLERLGLRAKTAAVEVAKAGKSAAGATGAMVSHEAAVKGVAEAYEAAVGSAKVFGQVTSVELESQVLSIRTALADQAAILGRNSDEYVRLEQVASEKIGLLEARIEGLRDGLGDLGEATSDAASGFGDLNRGLDDTRNGLEETDRSIRSTEAELQRLSAQALVTGASVASASGGGGRVQLAGGGSRLARPAGLDLGFNLSGGTFTTVRRII